jgi:hypothetical protein
VIAAAVVATVVVLLAKNLPWRFRLIKDNAEMIFSILQRARPNVHIVHCLKFGLSEEHTKFEKIFLMLLTNQLICLVNVKTMRKIFSNYVCFSKSLNFNELYKSVYNLFLLLEVLGLRLH